MEPWEIALVVVLTVYIAVCFGFIAQKHGRNPVLYGILSVVSPINLIFLGYWTFSTTNDAGHGEVST